MIFFLILIKQWLINLGGFIMKKALVLGASGSMGYAIVNELCGRGIHVVALQEIRRD